MNHYSDPTAAKAIGNVNREFSRLEKRAKQLNRLLAEGKISQQNFEKELLKFRGIYRHIPANVKTEEE